MTTLTITLYLEDEPGKNSLELAKEIVSRVHNSRPDGNTTITVSKERISVDLYTSKCPKKAPQSVLKAVSDSLDVVYSEGAKQAKNEKYSRVAYIPYDELLSVARCSNGKTYGETYGFPEYNHEGSTIICKVADLKDPASKGYRRFIEECNKYLSAMERI